MSMNAEMRKRIARAVVYLMTALATAISIAFGLSSCQVVREVTTQSQYVQRGDTTTQITVKTTEAYTGRKQ